MSLRSLRLLFSVVVLVAAFASGLFACLALRTTTVGFTLRELLIYLSVALLWVAPLTALGLFWIRPKYIALGALSVGPLVAGVCEGLCQWEEQQAMITHAAACVPGEPAILLQRRWPFESHDLSCIDGRWYAND